MKICTDIVHILYTFCTGAVNALFMGVDGVHILYRPCTHSVQVPDVWKCQHFATVSPENFRILRCGNASVYGAEMVPITVGMFH